jgi:O-succinylbenzoic acid--CoA ligase
VALEFGAEEGLHFAATLHALHRAELLPVPISQKLTEPERVAMRLRAQVDVALTATPEPSTKGRPGGGAMTPPSFERRLDAPAAILFTSGTEGAPRAVVLTHGNLLWSALASARNLGVLANDVWLSCVPLHHVGGLSVLTRSAYYGTAALIHDRFDPDAVNRAIDEHGVTLVSLTPPMLDKLLEARGARPFPASLRAALIGGGPAPVPLLRKGAERGLRALPTYGMTETSSQVTTLSPRDWPKGLDTAGRPLPFTRVEIRDPEGRALGPDQEGEIFVRGPMVAEAYFDDRARTDEAFQHRWFRTGDFGAWDEHGRLRVLDRRGDRMVVGGENVSPLEVEAIVMQHPAISEACVVALEAGAWGHEIAAVVVCRPGATVTLDELRAHAGQALASFKLPRRLQIVESLPRNASGKLLRGEIRSRLAQEMAQEHRA